MKKMLMFAAGLLLPTFAMAQAEDVGALNDAQIAHVAITANKGDIENGKLAKKKASNKEVRSYAVLMIKDHTNLNKEAQALVTKLKIAPEHNDVSKDLEADSKNTLDKLKSLSGKEFDESYIDAEVKLHQKVIEVADTKLVPNVKNAELKAMLTKARPILASHLAHAQKIKESLNKDLRQ